MESLLVYTPQLLITAGIAILALEVMVLGFATFILFFLGISMVLTGCLVWMGVIPASWTPIFLVNAVLTTLLAAGLWRPMLKMQNKTDVKSVKTDFDGLTFYIAGVVDKQGKESHFYSGITWQLKSEEPIEAGTEVEVVKAEVGVFWVKKVTKTAAKP